jgi:hypothetical protein
MLQCAVQVCRNGTKHERRLGLSDCSCTVIIDGFPLDAEWHADKWVCTAAVGYASCMYKWVAHLRACTPTERLVPERQGRQR